MFIGSLQVFVDFKRSKSKQSCVCMRALLGGVVPKCVCSSRYSLICDSCTRMLFPLLPRFPLFFFLVLKAFLILVFAPSNLTLQFSCNPVLKNDCSRGPLVTHNQFIYKNIEFNHPGLTPWYKHTSKPQFSSKSLLIETRKVLGKKECITVAFSGQQI